MRGPYDHSAAERMAAKQNRAQQAGRSHLVAHVRPQWDHGRYWRIGTDAMGMVGQNHAGPNDGGGGLVLLLPLLALSFLIKAIILVVALPFLVLAAIFKTLATYNYRLRLRGLWYGKKIHRLRFGPIYLRWQFKLKVPVVEATKKPECSP